ncbi:hypothetical protein ACIQRS_25520 [Streptomyces termitum]|uniref:Uncharacterized protein n=1 Tax=Streptomyces termitum TaxID=67368 RepID=A0A918WCZ9_9ACTN|nr:hypothetical protein [Streptomyces termitum]GHB07385.1 hypothetical protein GCM10010305_58130 [Streptomyces termitum]
MPAPTPMIFIHPELRPDLADTHDVEPVGIEDAIRAAVARGEQVGDKRDGVEGRFFAGGLDKSQDCTGKEQSEGTGKETSDTGKEACDAQSRVVNGTLPAVRDLIRPIM